MRKSQGNKRRSLGTHRWMDSLRRQLAWLTLIALLAAVLGTAVIYRYGALPAGTSPQATQILDADGNVIDEQLGGVNRRPVSLADISPWLVKATLAVEDRRFYDHAGVDVRGLARAVWVDMRHMSIREGASTLTQQLARNLYLSHERTWSRKLKEAWLAVRLEQTYSKDEILQMYLNQIYYGHGAYGAEAAARLYFGKPAKQLTLAESALLAGIPKGPRYYSPHLHPSAAEARRQIVLKTMVEAGALSAEEAARAKRQKPVVKPLSDEPDRVAPYFVDYVKRIAVERLGIDERLLNEGGLRIKTTLDSRMQQAAEQAVREGLPEGSTLQAALVAIDPRNGYIKAMVGGRSYKMNQYNRVFATTRQPGSSFKAILYAAALEKRVVTPATRFRSEPTIFYYDDNREIYRPANYANRYLHEDITLRRAIATSDNIYAVNTMMQVGPEAVVEQARKLGITTALKPVPSLALGTFPVSPFEMATAYSAFAGGGALAGSLAILEITDAGGKVLYEGRTRHTQVLSPAVAYVTTRLLSSVFEPGGTAHRVKRLLHGRPVAGKTGTTDSDAWFVGYTPELVAAVWVGYDRGRAISSSEAHRAAPIFARFLDDALQGVPPGRFAQPADVVLVDIDPQSGMLAGPHCPERVQEAFLAGTEPTIACTQHKAADIGRQDNAEAPKPGRRWWQKLRGWWGAD